LRFQAPEDPLKWRASAAPGGSPGGPDGDDLDSDGLPDAWEIQHGLTTQNPSDAMEDPDGDGHSNLEEYLAGTDPRDPRSHVRLRLEHNHGQLTLSGLQAAGRNVRILYRSNLWSGAWETWTNLPAPANAQEWRLDLPGATEGQRFYRLQLTWP
jgi:hypothetical protein